MHSGPREAVRSGEEFFFLQVLRTDCSFPRFHFVPRCSKACNTRLLQMHAQRAASEEPCNCNLPFALRFVWKVEVLTGVGKEELAEKNCRFSLLSLSSSLSLPTTLLVPAEWKRNSESTEIKAASSFSNAQSLNALMHFWLLYQTFCSMRRARKPW